MPQGRTAGRGGRGTVDTKPVKPAAKEIEAAEPSRGFLPREHLKAFLILVALAAALRIASAPFLINSDNPLFDPNAFPQGDLAENYRQAGEIVNTGAPESFFIHGPLYVYLLAATMKIFGGAFWPIYILQMAAGATEAGIVFLIGARLISFRAGLAAGLIATLYAPSAYYETILSSDSLIPVVIALMIYLGVLYQEEETRRWWAIPVWIGVLLGAVTLLRANLCLLGLGLTGWMLAAPMKRTLKRRVLAISIVAAISIAMLIPAIVWNSKKAGAPRFVVGESSKIWKFSWSEDSPGYFKYPDPESKLLSVTSAKTWELAATKAAQFFAWLEFPDLTNFHLYSRLSPPLRADPVTYRILSPLALLGVFLGIGGFRRLSLLYFSLVCVLAAAVLFYISGRYRLAVVPILFVFAGQSAEFLAESLNRNLEASRRWARLGIAVPLAVFFFVAVNRYDISNLHSMWHSDAIFGNFNIRLAKKALQNDKLDQAEFYARRLFWVSYPEFGITAHEILATIAQKKGDNYGVEEHMQAAKAIYDVRIKEPVLDQFGNRLFIPST